MEINKVDTLKFCKDGRLRTHFYEPHPGNGDPISRWVSVQAFELVLERDLFPKFFSADIKFEDGLTVQEFMLNLKPWSKGVGEAASIDFDAYLEELEKDIEKPDDDVSHVEIVYRADLREEPNFKLDEDRKYASREVLPKKVLGIEQFWHCGAILKEEARAKYEGSAVVSMAYSPLNEWRHLPIQIHEMAKLSETFRAADKHILNVSHHLAQKITNHAGDHVRTDFVLRTPTPTFHDAIMEGFFRDMFFHRTPEGRDAVTEGLRSQMDGIKNGTIDTRELDLDEASPEEMEDFQDSKKFEELLLEAENWSTFKTTRTEAGRIGFGETRGSFQSNPGRNGLRPEY